MANLKQWLLDAELEFGEPIQSAVVGKHYSNYGEPLADENIVLNRDAALAKIDLEFDDGFGGADCYPIVAWSESRVFLISEYDGSTSLSCVPRNPIQTVPEFK